MDKWCSVTTCSEVATVFDEGTEHTNQFCDHHGDLAEATGYTCFSGQTKKGAWIEKRKREEPSGQWAPLKGEEALEEEDVQAPFKRILAPVCFSCGTKELPGGATACSSADGDCMACEDCVCCYCNLCDVCGCACKESVESDGEEADEDEEADEEEHAKGEE